ncbi:hypothetical protein TVAG_102810 [Trichomonas vaginalis G3]|uniref:Uncharacterized protein n=1 Tax=Trichomonas vaginalis (strain ATCC PRA-98 / G3) TaxID=412133 RepID=A2ECY6_TRIV3|nr:fatty-acyl-CoA binding [Trichomonas vaginalis G3]EAY09531.1 hypothetical protein TVAG_102810 [Trichomonas vaginalis G3]KAI5512992.1 fatty-acyl-CoA binding [Trichomonas vaginalis G3]|eukprot:XP_001321754.1 hypothetical protein [Trichomonas vaginalis G3]
MDIKDCEEKTVLHYSVENKNIEITKYLVLHGADINLQDKLGRTPLHYAVLKNNKELAAFLISYCADTNMKDNHGKTALDIAINNYRYKIIQLFD